MEMLLTPEKVAVDNIYTESRKVFPDPSIEVIPLTVGKLKKISNPTGTRLWEPEDISGWTIRAAIGKSFLPPIAGDYTLAQGMNGPVLLEYDFTAQEIQDTLAIASINGTTEEIGAGYFKFTFSDVGPQEQITADASNLAPASIIEIGTLIEGDADTREVQTIRLMQSPAAYALLSTTSTPTAATVNVLATGGVGTNHKVRITFAPLPYDGRFSIKVGGKETALIAFDASQEDVQAALEALTSVGAGNVSVFRETIGQYIVAFQGSKAATNMGTITVDDSALMSITTKSGALDLRTPAIRLMMGGAESEDAFLEIEGTPPSGSPQKLYKQPITVVGSIITPGVLTPPKFPVFYTDEEVDDLLSVFPEVVNVKHYGATGDGATDDHTAIALAITEMNATGLPLYFPPGTYADSGEHIITNGRVEGAGSDNATWEYTGVGTFLTINTTHLWRTFAMSRIMIKGPSGSPWNGAAGADNTTVGIYIEKTRPNMIFTDVTVHGWGHAGISAHDCTFMIFDGCLFKDNKRGLVGGYKADLWTVRGCFFLGNDIGADIGYWDPSAVASPSATEPSGPTAQHWINVGVTSNRIGILIGGMIVSGVTFDGAYGEFNTQTMFMVGHDPSETWFPGDATRTNTQILDAGPILFGTRIIWRNCFSLNNDEFIEAYRHGQYELDKCTGSTTSGSVIVTKSATADQSRIEIRDTSGDVEFSTGATVALGSRADYPLQAVVIAATNTNTSLLASTWTKLTLDREILDSHACFNSSAFTAPQPGVVRVRGLVNATLPFAGQQLVVAARINDVDNADNRLSDQTAGKDSLSMTVEGTILLPVARGDTITLWALQTSAGSISTYAPITRMEVEYVRGY